MKKTLLIFCGVVGAFVLIVPALPLLIDVHQFKPALEADIWKTPGRQMEIGKIELSIISGGVTQSDVSIADDLAFRHSPFLTAKKITVGVSLLPLIFSKKLDVRSFTVVWPEVSLLRSVSGAWNFSSLGGAAKPGSRNAGSPNSTDFSVEMLALTHGPISLATTGSNTAHAEPEVCEEVDFEASIISFTSQFPFKFSTKTQGDGGIKLSGKACPIDPADASLTPLDATIST